MKAQKGSRAYNQMFSPHGYRPLRYTWQASHGSVITQLEAAIARLTGKAAAA